METSVSSSDSYKTALHLFNNEEINGAGNKLKIVITALHVSMGFFSPQKQWKA